MAGPWDSVAKRLLREKPQHIVSWLLKGAIYQRDMPTELKSRNIYADALFTITMNGKPALMHIECQSRRHKIMPERLLEYNVLAASENDWLPIYTFVIYLRQDGDVPTSPFIRRLLDGEENHRFHFKTIEVAKISGRSLLHSGLHGLYPLVLLTKDGDEPQVVQEMISTLTELREVELLALAYAFGGLISANKPYAEDFERSFAMLDDILEESWTYQKIVKKGLEKGLQQGRDEERHVRIQQHQETVLDLISMRFPELMPFAQPRIESVNDPDALHELIKQLFVVQTEDEARQAIINTRVEE